MMRNVIPLALGIALVGCGASDPPAKSGPARTVDADRRPTAAEAAVYRSMRLSQDVAERRGVAGNGPAVRYEHVGETADARATRRLSEVLKRGAERKARDRATSGTDAPAIKGETK